MAVQQLNYWLSSEFQFCSVDALSKLLSVLSESPLPAQLLESHFSIREIQTMICNEILLLPLNKGQNYSYESSLKYKIKKSRQKYYI